MKKRNETNSFFFVGKIRKTKKLASKNITKPKALDISVRVKVRLMLYDAIKEHTIHMNEEEIQVLCTSVEEEMFRQFNSSLDYTKIYRTLDAKMKSANSNFFENILIKRITPKQILELMIKGKSGNETQCKKELKRDISLTTRKTSFTDSETIPKTFNIADILNSTKSMPQCNDGESGYLDSIQVASLQHNNTKSNCFGIASPSREELVHNET